MDEVSLEQQPEAPVVTDAANVSQEVPQQAPDAQATPKITLNQLVDLCTEKGASDIHFREGGRVALRVGGKVIFIENVNVLSREDTEAMVNEMMPNDEERKRLESEREIDFSYTHTNGVNFRINAFYQRGKLAGVMRMITKNIPTLEELGIPESMKNFLNLREGLILICGAAGSGKSTTIQSMLQYINENFVKHVLTIENPIEYVFDDKKSMFTQRELGRDTLNMPNALKSAIREDANIVMISEITNAESLDRALDLVETGHLVISSMLTRNTTQTLERILSYYPQNLREEAQDRIATDMVCVLSQDLVDRQDQVGLVAVFELMFMNQSIRSVIKRGNLVQLRTAIQ
ncbi:type IV pilus twitching motility protein PilT, partial [candidate division KSB1 bacterium]